MRGIDIVLIAGRGYRVLERAVRFGQPSVRVEQLDPHSDDGSLSQWAYESWTRPLPRAGEPCPDICMAWPPCCGLVHPWPGSILRGFFEGTGDG